MKYVFAGDSWALKAWTEENYQYGNTEPMPQDLRLADFWDTDYKTIVAPGQGNLDCLEKIMQYKLDPKVPIVWVYTEPGRDYKRFYDDNEFGWMISEDIFSIRNTLHKKILKRIRSSIQNPIALIGGLSDIDIDTAVEYKFTVLCASWQRWIGEYCNSQHFQFGWGASDIGWRFDYNGVKPSKNALFAWDDQIKEWCSWEEHEMFCHEHPTVKANILFGEHLRSDALAWINSNAS